MRRRRRAVIGHFVGNVAGMFVVTVDVVAGNLSKTSNQVGLQGIESSVVIVLSSVLGEGGMDPPQPPEGG